MLQFKLGKSKIFKIVIEEMSEKPGNKMCKKKEARNMVGGEIIEKCSNEALKEAKTKAAEKARELYDRVIGIKKTLDSNYAFTDLEKVLAHYSNLELRSVDFDELLKDEKDLITDSLSGFLLKQNNKYTIYVNNKDSLEKRRFTIAHEIGHRALNHLEANNDAHKVTFEENVKQIVENGRIALGSLDASEYEGIQGYDRHEIEANAFAIELLMPEPIIRYVYYYLSKNIERVAQVFSVSKKMAESRLKELGVV